MMAGELVERWWNGRFGRLARRDLWLYRSTTWRVESREGDADSRRGNTWTYDDDGPIMAITARTRVREPVSAVYTTIRRWMPATDDIAVQRQLPA
jgi:hypothetical protein